ncbi:hypothetical protein TUM20985_36010 [Mycobacterium antarcticum]|uniref:hypothetical protein n=1 Tax=Mycolicibacterium sp. TUM20985 TaxID=3023370 RepID=UPI002572C6B6|nr:hypothetical protein [Mycolicibacterium sp. TUM20985]BDX33054.1 hypothetical protein TUM20985_36010 [Mycolicibacterium sp. TUM20985]
MNTSILTRAAGAAVLGTVVAMTAGLAPAAASPKQSGAQLFVNEDRGNPANYRLAIKGVFPMEQADAVGYLIHINDGDHPGGPGRGGMIYHLQADDGNGWPGDSALVSEFLPGTQTDGEGYLRATPAGIEYLREISVPKKVLDEDTGPINEEDEIYAVATFRDGDGGESWQVSQKIVRYFEAPGTCVNTCNA